MKNISRIIGLLLCGIANASAADPAAPPEQPLTGPGGKNSSHAGVIAREYGVGAQSFWLFEPSQPAPERAPLIVFNHGWSAMDPRAYQAWIDHLVKRGNIVVYPLYQDSLRTPPEDFTPNAIAATRDAIRILENEPDHVRPELDKVAVAGHSMGGVISANMAALWKSANLPAFRAIMCVEPGKTWGNNTRANVILADLSNIPAATLLLTVIGDKDHIVRDIDARRIFLESTQVPLVNKNYIELVSDDHGSPALTANHFAPAAWAQLPPGTEQRVDVNEGPLRRRLRERLEERREESEESANLSQSKRSLDALDFYGTWKLLDALTDAAFYGTNRNYALGNTPEQRFMGVWSDGVPVKPLVVTDHP